MNRIILLYGSAWIVPPEKLTSLLERIADNDTFYLPQYGTLLDNSAIDISKMTAKQAKEILETSKEVLETSKEVLETSKEVV